jgi:DNA-binding CsgD family transcriptional regulator
MVYTRALEVIQRIGQINSREELELSMLSAFSDFGIDHYNVVSVGDAGSLVEPMTKMTSQHRAWIDHYRENKLHRRDPFVPWTFQNTAPATWSWMESIVQDKNRSIFDEQREFVQGDAIVVPVHSVSGGVSCVIMSGIEPDLSTAARPVLRLLAYYLCELGAELAEASEPPYALSTSPLSPRQIECLKWIGEGKSDWEIGRILGIAEATVHRHVERSKTALGVGTRVQAFVVAWRNGWLVA